MTLIRYIKKRFEPAMLKKIEQANAIIKEYQAAGYDLTLRQLYYQFVSRDLIPNTQREYKKLGDVVSNARLAGLISWTAIVDRTRNLKGNPHWDSPAAIIDACAKQFQIDKWADQEHRVEVWVEKDALIGVIEQACNPLDVSYFSCRGYTSQSEMWVAAQRLKRFAHDHEQTPVIIHLGDHDPSGIDMSRDIADRLNLFMGGMEVNRIALNMDQVRKYNPPPNPAKTTDARAASYIKLYGHESWELDALDPKVLSKLITKTVLSYRDEALWEAAEERESEHRQRLEEVADELRE
jgi:hypothetical protein